MPVKQKMIYMSSRLRYTLGRTHVHILVRGEPMLTALYSEAR